MATPIPANRAAFSLGEIARATGGTVNPGDAGARVRGVSTDTRTLEPGALFVALVGESHDGHAHLARAVERGATAALVRRGASSPVPAVEVDDTLVALGRLARFHVDRARTAGRALPTVAITGSAGKTTTKELTAAVARALFGSTLATTGNLNNLIGVPMTLLALDETHMALVIECGTNARGEIARLGAIANPDVALVLNADAGHTLGLGSVEDVAVEKGSLFAAARRVALGNRDDARSYAQLSRAACPTMSFGESPGADVRLASREALAGGRARLTLELAASLVAPGVDPVLRAEFALLGPAAAIDAAAAVAAVAAMRGAPLGRAELDAIAVALGTVRAPPGRLSPVAAGRVVVLDDTYNANPRSVRASLEAASEVARASGGRLIVALGDMLELGALSRALHEEMGTRVAESLASTFVAVGQEMAFAARAAASVAGSSTHIIETLSADDAAVAVLAVLKPGDVVLVKGSRGIRMERVVEALVAAAAGEGAS